MPRVEDGRVPARRLRAVGESLGSGALVTVTVGAVVSLKTVTVTDEAVVVLPAASRATATSVCDPLLAVFVFQENE